MLLEYGVDKTSLTELGQIVTKSGRFGGPYFKYNT